MVDAGKPFVEVTYKLESDSPIVSESCDIISAFEVSLKMENYSNVQAVVKSIVRGECIKPATTYFEDHVKKKKSCKFQ